MPEPIPDFVEIRERKHPGPEFDPTRSGWWSLSFTVLFVALLILGLADRLEILPYGPPPLRLLLAWGWIVLAPGYFLTRLAKVGGGLLAAETLGVSAAVGLAVLALAVWLCDLFGIPSTWLPVISAAVSFVAATISIRRPPPETSLPHTLRSKVFSLVLLIAALALAVILFRVGGTLGYAEDGLGHVAAIRSSLVEERASPTSIWYAEGEVRNPDPRHGMFHGIMAVLASQAHMEPADVWLLLPGLLGPFLFLGFVSFARSLLPLGGAWLLAAALFLTGYGGLDHRGLRLISDPTYSAFLLYWVSVSLFLRGLRGRDPAGLRMAGFLAGISAMIHLYGFIQAVFAFGVLALGACLVRQARPWGGPALRVAVQAGIWAGPYLIHRFLTAWHPANPANFVPQGVMWINDRLFMVSVGEALAWLGFAGVFSFFALPWLCRGARQDIGILFLASVMLSCLLIVANPLLLPLFYRVLSYLSVRLLYAAPYLVVIAWAGWELARRIRRGPMRVLAALGLAVLALLFWPTARLRVNYFGPTAWEAQEGPLRWREELAFLGNLLPESRVFVSDAYSSYALPAFTQHHVVTIPAGHASPNDPYAVARLRTSESILSPYVGMKETLTFIKRHNVEWVLLNRTHPRRFEGFEFSVLPEDMPLVRAKFDAFPEIFHSRWDDEKIILYQVSLDDAGAALARDPGPLPPPGVSAARALTLSYIEPLVTFPPGFSLVHFTLSPTPASPGDTVRADCVWRRDVPPSAEGVEPGWWLYLRGNREYSRGFGYAEPWGKLYRIVRERRVGERYRFRVRHTPTGGAYPSYRWQEGELVLDSWTFVLPLRTAPGDYEIELSAVPSRVVWTFRLRDYLRDEDRFSGVPVGRLTVDK